MSTQRIEVQHNDREQVVEYLKQAVEIIDEHVVVAHQSPEPLVKVLELLASKTIHQTQPAPIGIPLGMPRMDVPRGGRH